MTVSRNLRTKDLATAARISLQQVRNLEADGFLPAVERSPSGYRRYTQGHLAALKASLLLMRGYGRPRARQIMLAVHRSDRATALAVVDERHAELTHTRAQLEQTLSALSVLVSKQPPALAPSNWVGAARRVNVGVAARMAGVQVSAVRFWEQQGLLKPVRDSSSRYRLYDARQLHRLQIVALLRQSNHDFPSIRATLDELEAGQPERVAAAIERRRNDLAEMSWRCVEALAALHAYWAEFGVQKTDLPKESDF